MSKHWTDDEIREMWPQARGELQGFERHLSVKAGITAAQLSMAIQLADAAFTAAAGQGASVPVEELERLRKIADVGLRYMWRYAGRERGHLCKPWSPRFLAFDGGEKCDLLGDWEHLRDLLGEYEKALAAKAGERAS